MLCFCMLRVPDNHPSTTPTSTPTSLSKPFQKPFKTKQNPSRPVVILSPHGYFGQSNVLGLPDTGGQVVYILDQV